MLASLLADFCTSIAPAQPLPAPLTHRLEKTLLPKGWLRARKMGHRMVYRMHEVSAAFCYGRSYAAGALSAAAPTRAHTLHTNHVIVCYAKLS